MNRDVSRVFEVKLVPIFLIALKNALFPSQIIHLHLFLLHLFDDLDFLTTLVFFYDFVNDYSDPPFFRE